MRGACVSTREIQCEKSIYSTKCAHTVPHTVPGGILMYFNLVTLLSRTLRAHVLRYARYSMTLHMYNGSTTTSRARRMVRRGSMLGFHHFAHSHDGLSPYPHYGWRHLSKAHAGRGSVCATATCRPNLRCMVHELGSGAAPVCANWETPSFLASRDTPKCARTAKECSGRHLKCFRARKQIPDGI